MCFEAEKDLINQLSLFLFLYIHGDVFKKKSGLDACSIIGDVNSDYGLFYDIAF